MLVFGWIVAIVFILAFINAANRAVNAIRSEAILYNTLKAQNEKYDALRAIFKRYEETNQIKPLKRDVQDFFERTEIEINKKLSEENKIWIR
jgi:hypothetical protein